MGCSVGDAAVLVNVNGQEITVERALRHVLLQDEGEALVEGLIDAELVRQHAERVGIAVSTEELQRAADEMRYDRGLADSERTLEWMRIHGQTLASVEQALELLLAGNKVASAIPERDIEAYYRAHRDALEYVVLFSIRAASRSEAAQALKRIDAGEPFPVVAADASRDPATRRSGGFVGRLRRAEMAADVADAVFDAPTGTVVGPVDTGRGWNLFLVAARRTPPLEEEAPGIRRLLFERLVARLRATAVVTWPGNTDRSLQLAD